MEAHVRRTGRYGDVSLLLGDSRIGQNHAAQWVAQVEQLGQVGAASLRRAMLKLTQETGVSDVLISEVPLGWFDSEESPVLPAAFQLVDGHIFLRLTVVMRDEREDDEAHASLVRRILAPLLARHGLVLEGIARDWSMSSPGQGSEWVFEIDLRCPVRGRRVKELLDAGLACVRLLATYETGVPGRVTVADLVRGGHVDLLLGQPKGEWLEVKRQEPRRSDEGKVAVARAVGRFCNSAGGVVVYGVASRKLDGRDAITKLHPLPRRAAMANDYRAAVRTFLYPVPEGVTYDVVDCGDGVLMVLDVPQQVRT